MKAPNRIYVASYNGEAFSHSWTMEPLGDTTATEYISKDALIEWLEECKNNPVITDLQKGNIQELMDKLNSM